LTKAESKQEKLSRLDKDVQEKIKEDEQWKKSIQLAQGKVVKDDVKLLKKTVKRKEQEKKKSSNEWSERQQKLKHEQESKQKKRETNLLARKETKGKVGKKSGKKRPGFEGKGLKSKK
jgi:hypothetical protein